MRISPSLSHDVSFARNNTLLETFMARRATTSRDVSRYVHHLEVRYQPVGRYAIERVRGTALRRYLDPNEGPQAAMVDLRALTELHASDLDWARRDTQTPNLMGRVSAPAH